MKFTLFSVSGLKDEKLIKKANLRENRNMQTILESFEHLSQFLSVLILIISSYTISKLMHFIETQCSCFICSF